MKFVETLVYSFMELWLLGLIAFLIALYTGTRKLKSKKNRSQLVLIFVQAWFVTFVAKLIFSYIGQSMQWSASPQSGFAQNLLPLGIGAYVARQLILLEFGLEPYKLKRLEYIGAFLVVSFILGSITPEKSKETSDFNEPELTVIVNRQASEGVTQDHMNQKFLDNFESYSIQRIREKFADHYKARSLPVPELKVRAESNYIILGTTKLAITRVFEEGVSNAALILGIKGDEILRVGCFSRSTYQVEVSAGECGKKIEQTYDVSFK
ncbi:MAG: hypothetical protein KJ725_12430 [Gammaproteobacteria bacterium]|uniref:hypothetical protein n=1 Tax=Methylotuvimicrobium sp. TaxID=2822413 RepID=UPI001D82BC26|nr:hypothetical protein [Gammaproteobacteria bacterium]